MVIRSFLSPAIVLGRKNIGETDRLMTVLTRFNGKMLLRAKGVRGVESKRRSHVELFNTIKIQVIEGKSFPILGQTELLSDRSFLKSDLMSLRIAFHLVELVGKMLPEHERQEEVFDLLDRALSSISPQRWANEPQLIDVFETRLLTMLGYGSASLGQDIEVLIEELLGSRLTSRVILQ